MNATHRPEDLKAQVRDFWNAQSCDTQVTAAEKFSKEYFDQIESFRYFDQPFIHSFAQFTRYHGKRVLEIGLGAGTDFVQWLRAGAVASGLDLTPEALENLKERIKVYQLPRAEWIGVGDAENLPFEQNSFDLGYSFGVLHHSPNTARALEELIRVVRPGGELKVMLYNRYSVFVFNQWLKYALMQGRPWRSFSWVLWNRIESIGTKAYTRAELARWFSRLPLTHVQIHTEITCADYLSASALRPLNACNRLLLRLAGYQLGGSQSDYVARGAVGRASVTPTVWKNPKNILFTGNRLGFFHCISARKNR